MRQEFEQSEDFGFNLEYFLNPGNVIGSVIGDNQGIFGFKDWQRFAASRLSAIAATIGFNKDRSAAEEFYNNIIDYMKETIGEVSDTAITTGEKAAARVSFCQNAAIGKAAMHDSLNGDGFFERLKPAYATLEILTSIALEYGGALSFENLEDLREKVDCDLQKYTDLVAKGEVGQRHRRNKFLLKKYQALSDNLDQSYSKAVELLAGLDIIQIRNTIDEQEIRYIGRFI